MKESAVKKFRVAAVKKSAAKSNLSRAKKPAAKSRRPKSLIGRGRGMIAIHGDIVNAHSVTW